MQRVYRSLVKVTTHKAPLESPYPHPPYQALHDAENAAQAATEEGRRTAAEETRHTAAEEADQADTPCQIVVDTLGDTHTPLDTKNPAEIQAAPHTPAPDNVVHVGTVSGPLSGWNRL